MNATTKIVVGVDTAKQVFQLHWVDAETGEVFSKQLKRAKFLDGSCQQSAVSDRNGGMWWFAALGAAFAGNGT